MTTGITAMLNYATIIFQKSFEDDARSGIFGSCIVGAANELAVILALPIIRRIKRKILLAIGLYGTVICNIVIAVTFGLKSLEERTAETIKIVMFVLFVIFYEIAPGPVILMQCGEVFPRSLKVKMNAVGFAFNWGWNIIITYTYRFFTGKEEVIHGIYAASTAALSTALLFICPETLNRPVAEVEREISKWTW